jgi:hypothetical protein
MIVGVCPLGFDPRGLLLFSCSFTVALFLH